MKVLISGSGKSGSWQIRGVQLGAYIKATVQADAIDVAPFDVAVCVKRPPVDLVARIRRAGVPLVWDVVDAWPQPHGNGWSRDECVAWLASKFEEIRPDGIIAATRAMASDCQGFGVPVLALPHHARPALEPNPIRDQVRIVGYEGGTNYLGRWKVEIEAECARRGWRFEVNPPSLASVDIVLAVREATGHAPRFWKSNVKLANAQGSGTPCIVNCEAGYLETACGAEAWVDEPADLLAAFDALESVSVRRAISAELVAGAPKTEEIVRTYREWLESNFSRAPNS